MKRITVFCGSSLGTDAIFEEQAYKLGAALAQKGIGLVYGGGHVGLMGAVANGAVDNKGITIGVIPEFLKAKELAHTSLTELIVVDTMHERKSKMNELSDGVIALPGGYGTLEELFEMLTWAQLDIHQKPIGILNTNGFYDDLLDMIGKMVEKGFLHRTYLEMIAVDSDIDRLLNAMEHYSAPQEKWLKIQH